MELSYRAKPQARALAAALGVVALVGALTTTDGPGALLLGIVGGAALAFAVATTFGPPALHADAEGVRLIDGVRPVHLTWDEVTEVRHDARERRGLTAHTLEVEAGDHLVVIPQLLLGAHPSEVVAALDGLRSQAG